MPNHQLKCMGPAAVLMSDMSNTWLDVADISRVLAFNSVCQFTKLPSNSSSQIQESQANCMGPAGVQMLDLSNTWVDDADISKLVEECPELRSLKLVGCRKLAAVSETLLTPDTGVAGIFTWTLTSLSSALYTAGVFLHLVLHILLCYSP